MPRRLFTSFDVVDRLNKKHLTVRCSKSPSQVERGKDCDSPEPDKSMPQDGLYVD
jgi:hypothetical protein